MQKKTTIILKILFGLSIFCLLIMTVKNQFFADIPLRFFEYINAHWLYAIITLSGGLLLVCNKKLISNIESRRLQELAQEDIRGQDFAQEYPDLEATRFGRTLLKPIYKQGIYAILLIAVAAIFCWVKAPYMDIPFSAQYHAAKYACYVEPAQHMMDHGPFWYQKDYLRTTAGNPFVKDGKYETFSSYPLLEWTLLATQKLLPGNSWEFNARLVMTIIGVILLFVMYSFLKYFFEKKQIILLLTLLSFNMVFQLFTHLTVLDPINLIFMFWALLLLLKGIHHNHIKHLYLAGVIAGIGINIKYHALIFYLPFFLALIYWYSKLDHAKKLSYILLIFPNFLLQTVFFWVSVRYIPTNPMIFVPLSVAMIGLQVFLYKKSSSLYTAIQTFIKTFGIKTIYIGLLMMLIICSLLVSHEAKFMKMISDFMTDQYLIFNWNMYITLSNFQIRSASLMGVYLGGFFALFIQFFAFPKTYKLILNTFLITAIIYIVLISKVMYFHIYYHHIPVIALIVGASVVYLVLETYKNQVIKYCLWGGLVSLFACWNIITIKDTLGVYSKDYPLVANFIQWNTKDNQSFLYNSPSKEIISLYAQRTSYFLNDITLQQFRKDLSLGLSFGEIAKKYAIVYFATCPAANFGLPWFADMYAKTSTLQNTSDIALRTRRISCFENNRFCDLLGLEPEVTKTMETNFYNNIAPYLTFDRQLGTCALYKISWKK